MRQAISRWIEVPNRFCFEGDLSFTQALETNPSSTTEADDVLASFYQDNGYKVMRC